MHFIGRLLKNSRNQKFIHLLETIFGVLIELICNHYINTTNESSIYCVNLFSKYAWVVLLKDKLGINIVNTFQKITSKRKPNKIWVDKGGEFYNNFLTDF